MSRKILICAVGVGLLAVACSEVYACSSPPPPPPEEPIARINGSAGSVTIYACKDSTVVFDGSASSDPDGGSITNYKWEFPAGADEVAAHECSCDGCGTKCLEGPTCDKVQCIFTSTGDHLVKLTVTDDDDPADANTCQATVKVVALNLTAYKRDGTVVSDDAEDDPGAYVADNSYDDDDVNGIEDKNTDIVRRGGVTKENDMIKVHFGGFDGFAGLSVGKVVIRRSGCIKLWRYDYKGEEIEFTCVDPEIGWYEKVYDLSVPAQKVEFEDKIKDKNLWLEGRCPALGSKLILKYTTASDELVCSDEIKVNVISAWLEVYKRDGSTKVAIDEELDPGAYVAYNNDDDDANGIEDKDTDLVRKDGVPKEDDTIKALFSLQHQFGYLDKGKVVLKRENAKIRLWKEEYKSEEIVFNSAGGTEKVYDFSVPAQKQECLDDLYGEEKWRWIEGSEASGSLKDTALTLIYKDGADVDVLVEPVKLTVIHGDLIIHNGLKGVSGGQALSEADELTKGAVTVTNFNDTDGDGVTDSADNDVSVSGANPPGRNEHDLMQLNLEEPKPSGLEGNVRVRWIAGVRVIWKNGPAGKEQCKSNGQATLTQPMSAFTSDNNGNGTDDIQWWVEGTYTSTQLRDIELVYEYQPPETSTWLELDRVKATVFWVSETSRAPWRVWEPDYSGLPDNPEPGPGKDLPDLDEATLIWGINVIEISVDGSRYGHGTHKKSGASDTELGGRILYEWEIKPDGAEDLGLVLDVTRQKRRRIREIQHGEGTYSPPLTKPDMDVFPEDESEPRDNETPTDDGNPTDEDNDPKNHLIYSFDGPSVNIPHNVAFDIMRHHFREWVRVKLSESFENKNDLVEGSRASGKKDWHLLNYTKWGSGGKLVIDSSSPSYSLPVFSGTGNGTIAVTLLAGAHTEGYTAEYDEPTKTWTLVADVSWDSDTDTQNPAPAGTKWTMTIGTEVQVEITQGSTAFADGDEFKFSVFKSSHKENEIDTGSINIMSF